MHVYGLLHLPQCSIDFANSGEGERVALFGVGEGEEGGVAIRVSGEANVGVGCLHLACEVPEHVFIIGIMVIGKDIIHHLLFRKGCSADTEYPD